MKPTVVVHDSPFVVQKNEMTSKVIKKSKTELKFFLKRFEKEIMLLRRDELSEMIGVLFKSFDLRANISELDSLGALLFWGISFEFCGFIHVIILPK